MNRKILFSAIVVMVLATSLQAQEKPSTMRVESQHKPPAGMEKMLPQHEATLIKTLESDNPTMQAQAVQTLRELEQMFPSYPFEASLQPLEKKLKDEDADRVVRRLAALALDELHSDAGDAVIKDVAVTSKDKGLQTLCNALLVRSSNK